MRFASRRPRLGSMSFGAKMRLRPPQMPPNTAKAKSHPHPSSSFTSPLPLRVRRDSVAKSKPMLPKSCSPTSRTIWISRATISSIGANLASGLRRHQLALDEGGVHLGLDERRGVEDRLENGDRGVDALDDEL